MPMTMTRLLASLSTPSTPSRRSSRSVRDSPFTFTTSSLEQLKQLVAGERGKRRPVATYELVCQLALGMLQGDDALLYRVLGDDLVDGDGAFLSDAMRAVGRLVLGGEIPPGIGMYDHGGTREVEPRAAGLERDEENGRVVLVELVDELNALSFGS